MKVSSDVSGEFRIKDSAVDPNVVWKPGQRREIHFIKRDGRELYKVWLYLDGLRVPFVDYAVYRLHPSFDEPLRTVTRTASNETCALVIWTWGLFEVTATVRLKSGESLTLRHQLTYDRDFTSSDVIFVEDSSAE